MRAAKKPPRPEDETSENYERFEALTKALVNVPKTEIQAEAEKHENAKEA